MKLKKENPAALAGITIHPKTVKKVTQTSRLLKPVKDNVKLGKGSDKVVKGKWKGMPMFSLTLQERATCPRTCAQWHSCFGNNMAFAHRVDHRDARFLPTLETELAELAAKHPGGFVVRLHILGDFYSVPYVNFWRRMLAQYSGLRIFGYTHRPANSYIGKAVRSLNDGDRVWIRASDSKKENLSAIVLDIPVKQIAARRGEVSKDKGVICPEQTGQVQSCLDCALCWSMPKPVLFANH